MFRECSTTGHKSRDRPSMRPAFWIWNVKRIYRNVFAYNARARRDRACLRHRLPITNRWIWTYELSLLTESSAATDTPVYTTRAKWKTTKVTRDVTSDVLIELIVSVQREREGERERRNFIVTRGFSSELSLVRFVESTRGIRVNKILKNSFKRLSE